MLQLDPNTKEISINRGDANQSFDLSIQTSDTEYYTFKTTDVVKFGIYEQNGLDKKAVLLKEIIPQEESTKLTIPFTKEEMTIGDLKNTETEYWYEIQLNDNTIVGYDKEKAKKFILYPEGSDKQ